MKKSGKLCCLEEGCIKRPSFNYSSKTKSIYCGKHKKEGMINVVSKTCIEECCRIIPNFNYSSETKGIYCGKHKKKGMIDVKHKICIEDNCRIRPNFNYSFATKGIYCGKHKKKGMVDVTHKICIEDNCRTQSNFNYSSKTKGIYCGKHKKKGMIDVKNKKICIEDNCKAQSIFNYSFATKGIYCKKHKKEGMVDIVNKTCVEDGCRIRPSYNYSSEIKGIYCRKHKKKGMVNVVSKTCIEEDCRNIPSYNSPFETKGIYCGKHKKKGMVDVTHKICIEDNCKIGVYCGFSGYSLTKCSKHKEDGMIAYCTRNCKGFNKINGRKTKCTYKATHGIKTSNPEFCEVHAPKEYFALTKRVCKGCKVIDVLTNKGLCFSCDPEIFKKRRLAKQRKVQDWLDTSRYNKDYKFTDKTFPEDYECFKRRRRPDFLYDCNSHFVILETDENQHNSGGYSCEAKRMGEIAQALGLPTIFIRYNPDEYKGPKGRKLYSTDAKRRKILLDQLSRCKTERIENFNKQFVRVLYLYYDGFDESLTPELEVLDIEKLY